MATPLHRVLVAVLGCGLLVAQTAKDRLAEARRAWDRGDYPTALERLIALRNGEDGDALHREIALLTGELYVVSDVAADGRSPRISPDGRYASYELPRPPRSPEPPVTRVVALDHDLRVTAEVGGSACSFASDSRSAVVVAPDSGHVLAIDLIAAKPTRLEFGDARFVVARITPQRVVAVAGGDLVVFPRTADGFGEPTAVKAGAGFKTDLQLVPGGRFAVYRRSERDPLAPRQRGRRPASRAPQPFVVVDLDDGSETEHTVSAVVVARGAAVLALVEVGQDASTISVVELGENNKSRVVHRARGRIANPALSPDGSAVVFQARQDDNEELFVALSHGNKSYRLTHEIQHDVYPVFLDRTTVMAKIGESRHRRAYAHDIGSFERTRLFHNNTIRTIAPQYEWHGSHDGGRVIVLAERDGNTVSPDRSIHVVDRTQVVSKKDLLDRLVAQLAGERALRAAGERMFEGIDAAVREATGSVTVDRVRGYQEQLAACGSRHITRPGNEKARDAIVEMFRSFGYEPEIQKISSRGQRQSPLGAGGSCNVIARLEGTVHPKLVYVLGSHYDSVTRGPGADDNGSGTAVTLEAARVLAGRALPATVVFVAFTGEESGLLGSRDFVRVAAAQNMHVLGALNNDMLGWANDERIDNTIRYSNPGIRDVQHNAALRYSKLITYDALYYKSTDAAAFYDAWGDIVGGIGSYPVLGNPHYHQATDVLATISHEQVAETAKTTVATLMLLASSPSRVTGLVADRTANGAVTARWQASPEKDVVQYEVTLGTRRVLVDDPRVSFDAGVDGDEIAVRAINERGRLGWDWARAKLE